MCSQVGIWINGKANEVKTFQKRCEVLRDAIRPYWVILNKAKAWKSPMWFQHQNMHSHACHNLGRVFPYHPIIWCNSSTKSDSSQSHFHHLIHFSHFDTNKHNHSIPCRFHVLTPISSHHSISFPFPSCPNRALPYPIPDYSNQFAGSTPLWQTLHMHFD